MASESFDEPCSVVAEQGEVEIDGLAGVAFSLTPRAALETADRLMAAAAQAAGQSAMRDAAKLVFATSMPAGLEPNP